MKELLWGIIGCGDVTEKKSGPAFNKVAGSKLLAVMRRNTSKASDYAQRHNVPLWYDEADAILKNDLINAIYIATPPSSHMELGIAAINAGKPVYMEKPMALNAAQAKELAEASRKNDIPLSVAHYRRQQPKFLKIKEILATEEIGKVQHVSLVFRRQLLTIESLKEEKNRWRIDPKISGGGLFHDLAPHQLDLLLYYFGAGNIGETMTSCTQNIYPAPDHVEVKMNFANAISFQGEWDFNCKKEDVADEIKITGNKGSISFTVFDENKIMVDYQGKNETIVFQDLLHVQQPMITAVAAFFQGIGENPCTGEEGVIVMQWIDEIFASCFLV